jgi:hypothetical protein
MRSFALSILIPFAVPTAAVAQETIDHDAVTRIRAEGMDRSQVMDTLWWLTDRYGPRLTNSPQERRALQWAKERLEGYGLANAALEPWGEFGVGWSFERCVVELVTPIYMPIIATPKAWTLGLGEAVRGEPILMEAESVADLEKYRGKLAGKIVLRGTVRDTETPFEPLAKRYDEQALEDIVEVEEPPPGQSSRYSRSDWRTRREVAEKARAMLKEEGALCVLETDGGAYKDYGVITPQSGGSYKVGEERALPQVVIATEHWNRIARLLQKGERVEVSVDVKTSFYEEDVAGYNVVAEIPGTDLAHEVVMVGGHFDSWHGATGATDNAIGSAVAMEALRIIQASGLKPRRTIRIGLWTGEEQGLLGSEGYVKKHFGDSETMELQPGHADLAAYFNVDNGGGRLRGIYTQGNAAVRPIFEAWLEPFHDLGATHVTIKNTGGTDHLSFDALGLPGFQFIQDPIDYDTRTHHTNMDTYERVHALDAKQAATIEAAFVYFAATRAEKLPREPLPLKPEPKPEAAAPAATTPAAAVQASAPRPNG